MKKKNIFKAILIIFLLGLSSILAINITVVESTKPRILNLSELKDLKDVDCIIVLGAGLNNGSPSKMLQERLDTSIEVYNLGITNRLIMTGDHQNREYDEVNVMKQYAVDKGISANNIFMDHAGLSTYESMVRAQKIFKAKKVIIITQEYHLSRALYLAQKLGLDAYGISATKNIYSGQKWRDLREVAARVKDFFYALIKPDSTFLGSEIPVSGNGNVTNDHYIIITSFKSNNEYYISMSKTIDKINSIINSYKFTKVTCDGINVYSLSINGKESYGIEVYDTIIHITHKEKGEIALSEEDSKVFLDIINND